MQKFYGTLGCTMRGMVGELDGWEANSMIATRHHDLSFRHRTRRKIVWGSEVVDISY